MRYRQRRSRYGTGTHHPRGMPAALLTLAAACVALVVAASPASAQRLVRTAAVVESRPVVDAGVERIRSEVTVEVDGDTRVARFEVHEEFFNHGGRLGEADYLYPIPDGAVFSNLSLFMGETELKGEMLSAAEARSIYEEIVRRRKDPALVELVGSGVIRARVFPIDPGDTRKIILRYTQVLPRELDVVRLGYARRAGFIAAAGEETQVLPSVRGGGFGQAGERFSLRVRITSAGRFGNPVSPTHAIAVHDRGGDVTEIVAEDTSAAAGDFELLLPMSDAAVGLSLITHSPAPDDEAGYFLMMLNPPPGGSEVRLPRDLTLVLDVSGSMSGHKLQQARGALEQILRFAHPEDRFRLVTFSSVVRSFAGDFLQADPANVNAAIDWLRTVPADGSTNLFEALENALEPTAVANRLALVVFLTDGLPTVAETDPERIAEAAERLRDGERVFTFGVGEDVNTYLLDRLARGGRGAVTYVLPTEDVEAAVASLNRKIGSPVLTDLRIVTAPAQLEDSYPRALPDLFAGEELMVLGRYRRGGSGALVIEGRRAGETVRLTFDVVFPERRGEDAFVTRLWAARKAGALTAEIRVNGPSPEVIEEIRQLGLRHGVLTEYTSYLVQEPGMALRMDADALAQEVRAEAAAPAAQTGAQAFRRARTSSKLTGAGSVAEAEEVMLDAALGESNDLAGGRANWMRAGRRLFVDRDGAWTDARFDATAESVAIEPYSAAWFELLTRLPGLREAAGLGDAVVIVGDGLVLRLEAGGADALDAADWRRIERAFGLDRS